MYYSGWAMGQGSRSEVQEAASRVNRNRDISEFVKNPIKGSVKFKGVLEEGSTVTEDELLAWADGGNLCFGGDCKIDGLNFSGSYYTD